MELKEAYETFATYTNEMNRDQMAALEVMRKFIVSQDMNRQALILMADRLSTLQLAILWELHHNSTSILAAMRLSKYRIEAGIPERRGALWELVEAGFARAYSDDHFTYVYILPLGKEIIGAMLSVPTVPQSAYNNAVIKRISEVSKIDGIITMRHINWGMPARLVEALL